MSATIELRERLGLTKPATGTTCQRCNAAESEFRKLLKDIAAETDVAPSQGQMISLNRLGWAVDAALTRIRKVPCESCACAWDRASNGLVNAENAIGELSDAGHLSSVAAKMIDAGIRLASDNLAAARALAECTREDFEDGAPPYSLGW